MAECVRATLLAGNWTLLANNTFVEWASIQAIRHAKPSLLISSFGVWNKVKPFSSLLIFNDQETATVIPALTSISKSSINTSGSRPESTLNTGKTPRTYFWPKA